MNPHDHPVEPPGDVAAPPSAEVAPPGDVAAPPGNAIEPPGNAIETFDVAAVGETMATLVTQPLGSLNAGARMLLDAGGAESNVAICLAQAGRHIAWVSRLGADSLGRMIKDRVGGAGVDVSLVATDPDAPTGLYLREPGRVWYYRTGSAASRLTSDIWAAPALRSARIVYLTGITPALSASCHELVAGALRDRPVADALYVFDINHRPSLWPPGRAAPVLADLARRADIVFVGRDEAAALWGTPGPDDVRALLREPRVLVVKDAGTGATSYGPHGRAHVAALRVEVVDPVGAGDAFAAGYLHGLLGGADEVERLACGHRFAAAVLSVVGDIADIADSAQLAGAAGTRPPPDAASVSGVASMSVGSNTSAGLNAQVAADASVVPRTPGGPSASAASGSPDASRTCTGLSASMAVGLSGAASVSVGSNTSAGLDASAVPAASVEPGLHGIPGAPSAVTASAASGTCTQERRPDAGNEEGKKIALC